MYMLQPPIPDLRYAFPGRQPIKLGQPAAQVPGKGGCATDVKMQPVIPVSVMIQPHSVPISIEIHQRKTHFCKILLQGSHRISRDPSAGRRHIEHQLRTVF